MSDRPELEDLDVFVRSGELDPAAAVEIERIIEEYKKRPEHALQTAEAERILSALGIHAPDYGITDARSLLEHWRDCRAELRKRGSPKGNGTGAGQADLGEGTGAATETPARNPMASNPHRAVGVDRSQGGELAHLMPSDIKAQVRDVLEKARQGKGNRPNFLTAFQILHRLPDALKNRLIEERGIGGKGSGQSYAAPSVVSDAAKLIPEIEIEYIDSRGLAITVADRTIVPSYEVCGLYRLKRPG